MSRPSAGDKAGCLWSQPSKQGNCKEEQIPISYDQHAIYEAFGTRLRQEVDQPIPKCKILVLDVRDYGRQAAKQDQWLADDLQHSAGV